MKNIDVTQIIDPSSEQPFTGRSLKFLQDASSEARAAIIQAFIFNNLGSYSLSIGYIITGCTLSNSNKYITDGEIFYGGEFYSVTGLTTGTLTNPVRLILTKTQDTSADPLKFTDGVDKNVHDIFTYVGTDIASGGILGTDLVSAYGTGKIVFTRDAYTGTAIATQTTNSVTYIDLTNATYTTPSTGGNKSWKVTAKSTLGFAPSITETGGSLSIYCGSNIDESRHILVSTATYVGNVQGTVVCQKILENIAPSTVIKLQIKAATAGNVTFDLNSLIIEEL